MKNRLKFSVEVPDYSRPGSFKVVYRNSVDIDVSVNIPYNQLIDTFRFLYGESVYVHFILSNLN